MQSQNTTDDRSGNAPVIGRATILILCGMLFWLFFVSNPGSVSATLALFGGFAGIVGYLGMLFTGRQDATGERVAS